MSIHSAKGLQSKVVFVPDISRDVKHLTSNKVLLAEGYKPGIKVKPDKDISLNKSKEYEALLELEKKKKYAELKRRLDVAAKIADDD